MFIIPRFLHVIVWSILFIVTSSTAIGKPANSAPESLTPSAERAAALLPSLDPLSVMIEGDDSNRVGDPVIVWVSIINESDAEQKLTNATVSIDPGSNSSFGSNSPCTMSGDGERTLKPGHVLRMTCKFPIANATATPSEHLQRGDQTSISSSSGWTSNWFTRILDAKLRFEVKVEIENSSGQQREWRFYPVVVVKAVDYSVFIGGVAGAMLLALFVLAERLLKNPEVRRHWVQSILVALVMGLRGGAIAVIALLLGKTTQGVGSPVSLSVSDFTGGVLMGLFSYPLASWISSALKLDGVFVSASTGEENRKQNG